MKTFHSLSVVIGCYLSMASCQMIDAQDLYKSMDFTEPEGFTSGIEGPAVDKDGSIYAVNFREQGTIGKITPDGKASLYVKLPEGSTGNGIRFDQSGVMYVADYTGHNVLQIEPQGKKITVYAHEPKMNQPNDLAICRDGTLFASDPNWSAGTGQLWRINRDGSTTLLEADMGTTNGVEVSPDESRLYVNESVQRKVWVYDLDGQKNISNKRLLTEFGDFGMDGMRCDVEGNLYITRHGKGTVAIISPEGKLIEEVKMKGTKPSNIAFGGPEGRTCYITLQDRGCVEVFEAKYPGRGYKMLMPE